MELETEKSSYNAFERFLYWFFIPVVFTAVLAGALLSMFDYDLKNQLLRIGNKIPIVASYVPEPTESKKDTAVDGTTSSTGSTASKAEVDAKVTELKKQLTDKNAQIQTLQASVQEKDQAVKDLEAKLTAATQESEAKAKTQEEYDAQVKDTATMYAKMNPSKSAPIIQNLTLQEQVLFFSQMKNDDRVKIMEKMDPKAAAAVSVALKDATPVKDQEIAALQERLDLNKTSTGTGTSSASTSAKMTKDDLSKTVANMTATSAAGLLTDMYKTNSSKVIEILNGMDVTNRSKIMSALADKSKETAIAITAKLAP